jgi:hypothetical protein
MPLSPDPTKRAVQLANLKHPANVKHGAYDPARLAPLREQYAVELATAFPSASEAEIGLLAHRQAQLHVLAEWQCERGLLANRQRGIPYPAVALHDQIARAFEKQYALLREREDARGDDPHAAWRALEAKYAEEANTGENSPPEPRDPDDAWPVENPDRENSPPVGGE